AHAESARQRMLEWTAPFPSALSTPAFAGALIQHERSLWSHAHARAPAGRSRRTGEAAPCARATTASHFRFGSSQLIQGRSPLPLVLLRVARGPAERFPSPIG